jgi:hypothetical protein
LSHSGISGAVIQNNDFDVGIILPKRGFNAVADIIFFVAGGDANGDERGGGWRGFYFNDDIKMILVVNPVDDNERGDEEDGGCDEIWHGFLGNR